MEGFEKCKKNNNNAQAKASEMTQLLDTTDAVIWADEWLKTIEKHPHISTDKGTMIGWFANAIMAGYDAGRRAVEELVVDTEHI